MFWIQEIGSSTQICTQMEGIGEKLEISKYSEELPSTTL